MGKIKKHTEYYCDICGDERMIDDEMYETCKDCPYYYGEINQCNLHWVFSILKI